MGTRHKDCRDLLVKEGAKWYHPNVYCYATEHFCLNFNMSIAEHTANIAYWTSMPIDKATVAMWKAKISRNEQIISDEQLELACDYWAKYDSKVNIEAYRGRNHIKDNQSARRPK
jgi:hypothetical protein